MKVEPSGIKVDERLQYLLDEVKKAVGIFAEGIRSSTEEQIGISFKAFTLKSKSEGEVKAIFDVIMSAVAIELSEQAKDLIAIYTFYHSVEKEEEEAHLMLHCRKVAPPTKEEIEAKIKAEEEEILKVVEKVKEEVDKEEVDKSASCAVESTSADVTLPHASGMAYFRPGAE